MNITLIVQNITCSGCEHTIRKKLASIPEVSEVSVVITTNAVTFQYGTHNALEGVKLALQSLGYPLANTENGLGYQAK